MSSWKIALFWAALIAFFTWFFRHAPLNDVGTPVLVVIPFGLILWLAIRSYSKRSVMKLPPDLQSRFRTSSIKAPHDLQAHSDLVRMCMGNSETVERLIQFELRKQPKLSRAQATRAARDRLANDRRV